MTRPRLLDLFSGGVSTCPGPLIWFDVPEHDAILECAACDYIIVAGSFNDTSHAETPLLREGMAA